MAVLSDKGTHCALPECSQLDFLPFRCDRCGKSFCLEHFRYSAHQCPNAVGLDNHVLVCPLCRRSVPLQADEDPNRRWDLHVSTDCPYPNGRPSEKRQARCPVSGCKELLTASSSLVCQRCKKRVCLKHRYEDAHECISSPKRPAYSTSPFGSGQRPSHTGKGLELQRQRFTINKRGRDTPRLSSGALSRAQNGGRKIPRTSTGTTTSVSSISTSSVGPRNPAHKPDKVAAAPTAASCSKPISNIRSILQRRAHTASATVLPSATQSRGVESAATSLKPALSAQGQCALPAGGYGKDVELFGKVQQLKGVFENPQLETKDVLIRALDELSTFGSLPTKILSDSKIGTVINTLARNQAVHATVRQRARDLVGQWRQDHRKRKASSREDDTRAVDCNQSFVAGTQQNEGREVEVARGADSEKTGKNSTEASWDWQCSRCTLVNPACAVACKACESIKGETCGSSQWSGVLQSTSAIIDLSD